MLFELPDSSFIDFPVYRLKSAEVAWINKDLCNSIAISPEIRLEEWLLDQFAYVTACYGDQKAIDFSVSKIYRADRYGADGQFCNGGSARCGIYGNYQIKGIGRNPLVSINMDYHHSHGKLCHLEAVNEAIWGEIYNSQLPYGAARTLAIITTNIDIVTEWGFGTDTKQPAALLIREMVIRPAHFMRATFFWPEEKFNFLRDNDAKRVQESINKLLKTNDKEVYFNAHNKKHSHRMINSCVQRIAMQIAVSRIKRVPHGSLSCSNIGLNGEFIDFSTASAVSDYNNYVLVNDFGGVLDDHLAVVVPWINELIFYINKYHEVKITAKESSEIIRSFEFAVNATENIELMKLVGAKIPANKAIIEGGKLKKMLRRNISPTRFVGYKDDDFNRKTYFLAKDMGLRVSRNYSQIKYFDPTFMCNLMEDLKSLCVGDKLASQTDVLISKYILKSA